MLGAFEHNGFHGATCPLLQGMDLVHIDQMVGSAMDNQQWRLHSAAKRFQRDIGNKSLDFCSGRKSKSVLHGFRGDRRQLLEDSVIEESANADTSADARVCRAGQASQIATKADAEAAKTAWMQFPIARKEFNDTLDC